MLGKVVLDGRALHYRAVSCTGWLMFSGMPWHNQSVFIIQLSSIAHLSYDTALPVCILSSFSLLQSLASCFIRPQKLLHPQHPTACRTSVVHFFYLFFLKDISFSWFWMWMGTEQWRGGKHHLLPSCFRAAQTRERSMRSLVSPKVPGLVQQHPHAALCAAPTIAAQSCGSLRDRCSSEQVPSTRKAAYLQWSRQHSPAVVTARLIFKINVI